MHGEICIEAWVTNTCNLKYKNNNRVKLDSFGITDELHEVSELSKIGSFVQKDFGMDPGNITKEITESFRD